MNLYPFNYKVEYNFHQSHRIQNPFASSSTSTNTKKIIPHSAKFGSWYKDNNNIEHNIENKFSLSELIEAKNKVDQLLSADNLSIERQSELLKEKNYLKNKIMEIYWRNNQLKNAAIYRSKKKKDISLKKNNLTSSNTVKTIHQSKNCGQKPEFDPSLVTTISPSEIPYDIYYTNNNEKFDNKINTPTNSSVNLNHQPSPFLENYNNHNLDNILRNFKYHDKFVLPSMMRESFDYVDSVSFPDIPTNKKKVNILPNPIFNNVEKNKKIFLNNPLVNAASRTAVSSPLILPSDIPHTSSLSTPLNLAITAKQTTSDITNPKPCIFISPRMAINSPSSPSVNASVFGLNFEEKYEYFNDSFQLTLNYLIALKQTYEDDIKKINSVKTKDQMKTRVKGVRYI
jgi:hypothetical protein